MEDCGLPVSKGIGPVRLSLLVGVGFRLYS